MNSFDKSLQRMKDIHDKKSHDYAEDGNPFSNFIMCENLGICKTEEGFLVRMTDKLSRIIQLLKKDNKVKDETIQDTLIDLAVYSIRLMNYIDIKKKFLTHGDDIK